MPQRYLLHLLTLWTIAVAHPLYSTLVKTPEFFVIRGSQPIDIFLMAITVSLLVPLLAYTIVRIVGLLWPRLQILISGTLLAALTILTAQMITMSVFQGWTDILSQPTIIFSITVTVGVLFLLLYYKLSVIRSYITIFSITAIVTPLWFLSRPEFKGVLAAPRALLETRSIQATHSAILVIFDELPLSSLLNSQGKIDRNLFPNFAKLADTSTWFPHATTASSDTAKAVPVILTGKYPPTPNLPNFSTHPHNLFTRLAGSHELRILETLTSLCPAELCNDRPQQHLVQRLRSLFGDLAIIYLHKISPLPLRKSLPPINLSWGNFIADPAKETIQKELVEESSMALPHLQFEKFLNLLSAPIGDKPILAFHHVMLPHPPWRYLPSGEIYDIPDSSSVRGLVTDSIWGANESIVLQSYDRYIAQLQFTDKLLGRLLDQLSSNPALSNALLVITSDHGASFRPGSQRREPTLENVAEILPIPLFIKFPSQDAGTESPVNANSIDIAPTIVETLHQVEHFDFDGQSLSSTIAGRERIRFFGNNHEYPPFDLNQLHAKFREEQESGWLKVLAERKSTPTGAASSTTATMPFATDCKVWLLPNSSAQFLSGEILCSQPLSETMRLRVIDHTQQLDRQSVEATEPGRFFFTTFIKDRPETGSGARPMFHLVEKDGSEKALDLTSLPPFATQKEGDDTVLISWRGERLKVEVSEVGYIDSEKVIHGRLFLHGWAGSPQHGTVAKEVLVFLNGTYRQSISPFLYREDVKVAYPKLSHAGFVAEIPVDATTASDVRLFARFADGSVGELRRAGK